MDDKTIEKGGLISEEIFKAIKESRIAVIVFSHSFASSSWCLDEVAKIMDREAAKKIIALPVFYNVDPREVRKGKYKNKEFFNKHADDYDSETVKKWKEALKKAGLLFGWEFNNWTVAEPPKESITDCPKDSTRIQLKNQESKVMMELREGTPIQLGSREIKDEAQLVESIVEEISILLQRTSFRVTEFQVGIDSQVTKLIDTHEMKSEQTCTIGLWSMRGMGKTTLAKALYNSKFLDFEGSAYVDGIKGAKQETDEMVRLQKKLLRQLLTEKISLNSDFEGRGLIAKRLSCKRVLLILDDVDDICQINNLAQAHWFGKGSKIIITTTDSDLLKKIPDSYIHNILPLNEADAGELFRHHASRNRRNKIGENFGNYVDKVVQYTKCHPLALKVLGGAFSAFEENKWEGILDKFNRSSDPLVDKALSVSYDGLDPEEKQIFLHIACFFNGWSRTYVESVLKNWYFRVDMTVSNLIRRSLIMDENGTLKVHELVELMGKNIVDRECHDDAAKRSRLWRQVDVINVLSGDEETDAVKAIVLALPKPETIDIRSEAFAKLKNLGFLIMINVKTNFRDPICLPRKLRWFEWPECPASSLKLTSPDNLAVLAVRRRLFKEPGEP